MNSKKVNQDKVFAKLVALSAIYAKEESFRNQFLQRISYSIDEMAAVLQSVCNPEFRSWIEAVIPVMQCRENRGNF